MLRNRKTIGIVLTLAAIATTTPSAFSEKSPPGLASKDDVERGQTMLLSLKSAPRSSGFFILESIRKSNEISADIDRAMRQIEAVDATYAKSRQQPDTRYLSKVKLRLTATKQTADQLHLQLEDSWGELKDSIKTTLVTDPNFKP
jgi:hypothetical protein